MTYIAFAASVFCAIIFVSCGQNEAGGTRIEAAKPNLPAVSTPATPITMPVLPTGNPTAPIIASAKLNPAHGQPGHRCDIAVGAALPPVASVPNFKSPTPSAPVLSTPVQNPLASTAVQAPVTTSVASGLNPAHGQPGHRCDIPVGQPLNSKPAAKSGSPNTATPVASPAVSTTPVKSDGLFAKGLNPAHGQAGHRCDIAVGQPLSGAPKKDSLKN